MAGRISQSLSAKLYMFLCSKIGTEAEVRTRRMYSTTTDYINNFREVDNARITSGSIGEGLNMKGSDIDIMQVLNFIEIFETFNRDLPQSFFMETDDSRPGFTQLKSLYCKSEDQARPLCVLKGRYSFLSSELFKLWAQFCLASVIPDRTIIHGPCVSDVEGKIDQAFCLRCRTWINQAQPWIKRNRVWPTSELVSVIISFGVLFVPIGCKGSPYEELEWRISFSLAEKQLIYSFTHTQLLCYALLKILLKEIVDKDINCRGLLCSYFLKTIVFWVSEELPISVWRPENMIVAFRHCLRRLIYCVEYLILPHYFIIENNLFEKRFNVKQQSDLKRMLSHHYHNGICSLLSSETMSDFFNINYEIPNHLLSSVDMCSSAIDSVLSLANLSPYDQNFNNQSIENCISLFNNFSSKSDKFVLLLNFYNTAARYGAENAIDESKSRNKHQYELRRRYLPYVCLGIPIDAVTGWFYLATYFYCLKQYRNSLQVLEYIINKCTPDKIYETKFTADCLSDLERMELQSKNRSVHDIYRTHVLTAVGFKSEHLNIVPIELRNEAIFKYFMVKPPVVYAHFLSFLCCYHLNDREGSWCAFHHLLLTVREKYFIRTKSDLAESYNCLGIAMYMSGAIINALQCFHKSPIIDDDQAEFATFMLKKIIHEKR